MGIHRNRWMLMLVTIPGLLLASAATPQKPIDPTDGSIEGSIQLLINLSSSEEKSTIALVKRYFNPAAKPELIRQMKIHPQKENLIANFGYVAEASDLKIYSDYFENEDATFDFHAASPAHALAIMSRRGIAEADVLLDQILSPNYWKDRKINVKEMPQPFRADGNPEGEMFLLIAPIKARTSDPKRYDKIAAALDEIRDERVRNKIASETQIANYVHGFPRYSALSENYVKNIQPAIDARSAEFQRKRQEEAEKRMQEFESKARKDETYKLTVKVHSLLEKPKKYMEYSGASKAALVNEASQFMDAAIKPWVNDPVEVHKKSNSFGRMAENGFPMFHPVKLSPSDPDGAWLLGRGKSAEYIEEVLQVASGLFQKPRDVEHARVFALDRLTTPEELNDPKSQADVIVVVIPLKNAEALAAKFPKLFKKETQIGGLASLDANGAPLIHCIFYRHLNKWFWNVPG